MNRVFSPILKSVCLAALALSSLTYAAEGEHAAAKKVDPAKGEAIYSAGIPANNVAACVACHGAAGNSTISQNPKLASQHEAYIYKQLGEFKDGKRNNAVMGAIAKGLSDDDMKNIAAYLNAQALKPGAAKNKDTIDLGKKIYRAGVAEKNVPACAGCHGPNGAGIPAQFARLGGQHQDYTIAQLDAFRAAGFKTVPAGVTPRKNSPQMIAIAGRLSDDEIGAVADYIAGLK
ncbi:MAG: cytochrome c4 [Proteobacteria bacterium]|nr:cytochrome c4 [Pseudomonadota bacterium]